MHFGSFYKFKWKQFLWPYSSCFSLVLGSVLDTESVANLAHIGMFISLTLTQAKILWGMEKKNSASWDYLLLSQSITLSDWICHLSKCPEAICFVCNKSPSEGPICLLFSVIPETFLSCTWFFLGLTLIISDWIVHPLGTYSLLVFTILRCFFTSPPKRKYFCLLNLNLTEDFLLVHYSHHKLDVLLATGRVALKHLGFFNCWFKWTFASQKCSYEGVLGEVPWAEAISCSLWFCPVLAKGGMLCQSPTGGDAGGVCGSWESQEQSCSAGWACRAMRRENHLNTGT